MITGVIALLLSSLGLRQKKSAAYVDDLESRVSLQDKRIEKLESERDTLREENDRLRRQVISLWNEIEALKRKGT